MLKNRVLYLFMILYGSLFIILYNGYQTFFIYLLLCLLPLILAGVLVIHKNKISVELGNVKSYSSLNEPVCFEMNITNASKLFPLTQGVMFVEIANTLTGESVKERVMLSVNANSKETMELRWNTNHCGNIILTIYKIKLYDYLGIFSCTVGGEKQKSVQKDNRFICKEVLLLPPEIEIPDQQTYMTQAIEDSSTFSKSCPGEDPSEIFDMHDYREGDKLNRIHWKLSYKRSTYVVKDYSYPINHTTTILLNMKSRKREVDFQFYDALFTVLYNVSIAMLTVESSFEIIWYHDYANTITCTNISNGEELYSFFYDLFTGVSYQTEHEVIREYSSSDQSEEKSKIYYITEDYHVEKMMDDIAELNTSKVDVYAVTSKGYHMEQYSTNRTSITISYINQRKIQESFNKNT